MFLRKAKEKGCLTANGLLMLVAQAVYAEEIWLQKSIGEDVILRIARQLGGD
jgi:shikimate 5-dehydrogenase